MLSTSYGLMGCIVTLIMLTALAAIDGAHRHRGWFSHHALLEEERDAYHHQWSRLLIEQGVLSSHSRIENLAKRELDMVEPRPQDTVMVRIR